MVNPHGMAEGACKVLGMDLEDVFLLGAMHHAMDGDTKGLVGHLDPAELYAIYVETHKVNEWMESWLIDVMSGRYKPKSVSFPSIESLGTK